MYLIRRTTFIIDVLYIYIYNKIIGFISYFIYVLWL